MSSANRARSYELRQRDYLLQISRALTSQLDLDEVLRLVITYAVEMVDGHVGLGYAKSRPEELATIRDVCRSDGIVLDPVYTGKAFHGVVTELKQNPKRFGSTVAFVHTGGMFGLFASPETVAQVL